MLILLQFTAEWWLCFLAGSTQVMSRQFVTADIYRLTVFLSDSRPVAALSITMLVFAQLGGKAYCTAAPSNYRSPKTRPNSNYPLNL